MKGKGKQCKKYEADNQKIISVEKKNMEKNLQIMKNVVTLHP